MTGQDTDWLRVAKHRDGTAEVGEDGPAIVAALIAVAEELRKINDYLDEKAVADGLREP